MIICEKRRKENINDLEVIFMLRWVMEYILEIKMFGKVVVNEYF